MVGWLNATEDFYKRQDADIASANLPIQEITTLRADALNPYVVDNEQNNNDSVCINLSFIEFFPVQTKASSLLPTN